MNTALIGILFALGACISWAAANIVLRFGIAEMRIFPATAVSLLGGLLYVLVVNLIFDPGAIGRMESSVILAFALVGVVQFLGSRSLFYRGVALIGVGRATALGGGSPIMGSLLAVFFLGEVVTLSLAGGILAVVIGTTIIVSDDFDTALAPHQTSSTNFISQSKLGFISIIASSFFYSAVQVFVKNLVGGDVSVFAGSLIALGSGAFILLLSTAKNFKRNYDVSRHHLLLIFVAGMLASNGLLLSFLALERTPVVMVSPIIGITPLITLVLAAIFLRELEKLTFKVIFGSIIVVAGVILVVLAK